MGYYYDYSLEVRYGEAGHDGRATLAALTNWMQEAAGRSAQSLGFGDEVMAAFGIAWILSRQVLRIKRLPVPGEAVRVRTWPSFFDRFGHRGYEVYDAQNNLIVSSGCAWALMDMATRRLASVPAELAKSYPQDPSPCDAFICRALPRLVVSVENCLQAPVLVRRDDLDVNRHVNNAHYYSWLLEALPFTPGQVVAPALIDVTFRAECFPGDVLTSVCAPLCSLVEDMEADISVFGVPAPHRLVHAIRREHNGEWADVCRAVTLWTKDPSAR